VFVGHVSMDLVETPRGTNFQPGGAALYAALAARTIYRNVRLATAIGRDYEFTDVLRPFPVSGIKRLDMPSTRFHIRYDECWNAHYLKVQLGAGARIGVKAIPSSWLVSDVAVHLAPMRPTKVLRMIKYIRSRSPKALISVNTWGGYIKEGRKMREALKQIAREADFFILNDEEARALAGVRSLARALETIQARTLVVTLGELGAIISSEERGIQIIPALAVPVGEIVDTTGAGDSWCGAFMAAYVATGDPMKAVAVASVIAGLKCRGWGPSKLLELRFRSSDEVIEYVMSMRDGFVQRRLTDFLGAR